MILWGAEIPTALQVKCWRWVFFSPAEEHFKIRETYSLNIIFQNIFCCVTLASVKGYFGLQSWRYVRLPLRSPRISPSRKYILSLTLISHRSSRMASNGIVLQRLTEDAWECNFSSNKQANNKRPQWHRELWDESLLSDQEIIVKILKPYFNYKLDFNLVFTSLWQVDTGFAILFFIWCFYVVWQCIIQIRGLRWWKGYEAEKVKSIRPLWNKMA